MRSGKGVDYGDLALLIFLRELWTYVLYNYTSWHGTFKFVLQFVRCDNDRVTVSPNQINIILLLAFPVDIGRNPASPSRGSRLRRLRQWRVHAG